MANFLRDRFPEIAFHFEFGSTDESQSRPVQQQFDFCGIYAPTQAWNQARIVAEKLRNNVAFIAVGGPHISAMPECLSSEFDAGCVGAGEPFLEKLFQGILASNNPDFSEILPTVPGAVFKSHDVLVTNPADYSTIDTERMVSPYKYYLKPNRLRCRIISSVGCPHTCYFCAAKVINPRLRFRTAEALAAELEDLYNEHGISDFKFVDDNFLANKNRVISLIEQLKEKNLLGKITISCTASSKLINAETVKLLKMLNTESVNIGFESGSARILKVMKDSQVTLEDHERAIKLLNQNDIMVYGTFVMGLPGETEADLRQTFKFARHHKIHHLSCYLLKPLPGTPFWSSLVRDKKIIPEKVDFSQLAFFNEDSAWYFNDAVDLGTTLGYMKKINMIGTI